jgi:hypothetical protein
MWNIILLTNSIFKFRKLYYLIFKKKIQINFTFLIGKKVKKWCDIYKKEKRKYMTNQLKITSFSLEYILYTIEYFLEFKNVKNILIDILYIKNNIFIKYDSFSFLFKETFEFKLKNIKDIISILFLNDVSSIFLDFNYTHFFFYNKILI